VKEVYECRKKKGGRKSHSRGKAPQQNGQEKTSVKKKDGMEKKRHLKKVRNMQRPHDASVGREIPRVSRGEKKPPEKKQAREERKT